MEFPNSRDGYGKPDRYQNPSDYPENPQRPERYTPGAQALPSTEGADRPDYQQLGQLSARHYPAATYVSTSHDIDHAFRHLKNAPLKALGAADALLIKYRDNPSQNVRVVQLKARALFRLNNIKGCIDYINSLPATLQHDKGVMMAKARALETCDNFTEALPLFRSLYQKHSESFKNEKTYGIALARLLEHMGGVDNTKRALDIFARLRRRKTGGEDRFCGDREIEITLARFLENMGGTDNLNQALDIYTRLRKRVTGGKNRFCGDKEIELTLARLFEVMGGTTNLGQALDILTRLRAQKTDGENRFCGDTEIEITLARLLQTMGGTTNLGQALDILTRLRAQKTDGENRFCGDTEIETTLAMLLQTMGGTKNMKQALDIYTKLREQKAGRKNTPCDDKYIELTLGRHYHIMGGVDNLQRAMAIFTGLRIQKTGGDNRFCDDKKIELALARLLQTMGGTENLQQALDIFTELRTRKAGEVNAPCDDKDIELALSRLLQIMGGKDNLGKALDILTRLRTRAAGRENTPCDVKDIELGLGSIYIDMEVWIQFDELQLETRQFSGFETSQFLSIRYYQELLSIIESIENISSCHNALLGKALMYASVAVEKSGETNPSCISQLAHCFRLLSHWPQTQLKMLDIEPEYPQEFKAKADYLFDKTNKLDPNRKLSEKDQAWRQKEKELLDQLDMLSLSQKVAESVVIA